MNWGLNVLSLRCLWEPLGGAFKVWDPRPMTSELPESLLQMQNQRPTRPSESEAIV